MKTPVALDSRFPHYAVGIIGLIVVVQRFSLGIEYRDRSDDLFVPTGDDGPYQSLVTTGGLLSSGSFLLTMVSPVWLSNR